MYIACPDSCASDWVMYTPSASFGSNTISFAVRSVNVPFPGTPPIPHVGGPIMPPGNPTVLIGSVFAATMGDMCVCVGPLEVLLDVGHSMQRVMFVAYVVNYNCYYYYYCY